jgi:hypothetical protein
MKGQKLDSGGDFPGEMPVPDFRIKTLLAYSATPDSLACHRIGRGYSKPPWLHSSLRPRGIAKAESAPRSRLNTWP